jgi:hypothetical protein
MNFFLERKFSDYIVICESQLEKVDNDSKVKSALLCNIASAEYELELYRKCIKTCDTALKLNSNAIRAQLLNIKSLVKLGKDDESLAICDGILRDGQDQLHVEDINIVLEIRDFMALLKFKQNTALILQNSNNSVIDVAKVDRDIDINISDSYEDSDITNAKTNTDSNVVNQLESVQLQSINQNGLNIAAGEPDREATSSCNSNEYSSNNCDSKKTTESDIKSCVENSMKNSMKNNTSETDIYRKNGSVEVAEIATTSQGNQSTPLPSPLPNTGSTKSKKRRPIPPIPPPSPTPTATPNSTSNSMPNSIPDSISDSSLDPPAKFKPVPPNTTLPPPPPSSSSSKIFDIPPVSQPASQAVAGKSALKTKGNSKTVINLEPDNDKVTGLEGKALALDKKESSKISPTSIKPTSSLSAVGLQSTKGKGTTTLTTQKDQKINQKVDQKVDKEYLEHFLSGFLNSEDAVVTRTLLRTVRTSLSCAHGEDVVDDMIAFGYLQVNTGKGKGWIMISFGLGLVLESGVGVRVSVRMWWTI